MDPKQTKFSANDRDVLRRNPNVSWVPKDPAELLLPYIEKDLPEEKDNLTTRRKKASEILSGYDKIIEECTRLEDELSMRCKNVRIPLSRGKHLRTIEACNRVFGREDIQEITFEMYKMAIQAAADRNDSVVPTPED